jgi:hypothetical protein
MAAGQFPDRGADGMSEIRKKETSLAPMILGAAAIGILLVFGAVYFLSGYVKKQMSQSVPHLTPQREGPVIEHAFPGGMYATAQPVNGSDAQIPVDLPTSGSFQIATGEFETHDEMDEVLSYYRKLFGKQAEESREAPDKNGKAAIRWTLKNEPGNIRIVSVKEVGGWPHIRLVWIEEEQP